MAFVKLRNLLGKEIKIPAGAVKSYKNLGFYPEDEFKESEAPVNEDDEEIDNVDETSGDDKDGEDNKDENKDGKSEDEIFVEEISKKPLAQWNKNEVKRYAVIFNIDLAGTKSADEAKERIKAFMTDNE